jgi:hypothetical protein
VWGITELKVNAAPQNKTEDLTKRIKEVMGSLDRDTVARACRIFCYRIEAVIAADGDFFKIIFSCVVSIFMKLFKIMVILLIPCIPSTPPPLRSLTAVFTQLQVHISAFFARSKYSDISFWPKYDCEHAHAFIFLTEA